MKTSQEIQAEARELMVLGSRYQNEQRIVSASASTVAMPRVLVNLPVNAESTGRERHVEAAVVGGALVYRLLERETDVPGSDRDERDDEGTLLASSPSAYDVLSAGYEMAEEERLATALEPYADRSEDRAEPADSETVGEVEAILETNLLSPSYRLRAKAEVAKFLEGRLEPSALIARNIERQCSREGYGERLTERHELKLTIGEP